MSISGFAQIMVARLKIYLRFWIWPYSQQSVVYGLSIIMKFCIDRTFSFRDIAISIFGSFGFKLHIYAHFGGVWGIFIQITSIIIISKDRPSSFPKDVIWAIKRGHRSSGLICMQDRENTGQNRAEKCHKTVIFHLLLDKPQRSDLNQNLPGNLTTLITSAKL